MARCSHLQALPLLFSLPQVSFPSAARVQSYPLFKAQHKSHLLRAFLNAHPSPAPAKSGGDLFSQTHRTWPILFSWSSSGYPWDSCLYGSVLSLILILLRFPAAFSTLTMAGQTLRLNINLLNEHMNERARWKSHHGIGNQGGGEVFLLPGFCLEMRKESYPQTPCSDGWLFSGSKTAAQEMRPVEETEASVPGVCSELQIPRTGPSHSLV